MEPAQFNIKYHSPIPLNNFNSSLHILLVYYHVMTSKSLA